MVGAVFMAPWWLTLIFAAYFIFIFPFYVEAIFFAFIMDLLYAAQEVIFHNFRFVSLVVVIVIFMASEYLKRRILA